MSWFDFLDFFSSHRCHDASRQPLFYSGLGNKRATSPTFIHGRCAPVWTPGWGWGWGKNESLGAQSWLRLVEFHSLWLALDCQRWSLTQLDTCSDKIVSLRSACLQVSKLTDGHIRWAYLTFFFPYPLTGNGPIWTFSLHDFLTWNELIWPFFTMISDLR